MYSEKPLNFTPVTDAGKVLVALMESWRRNEKIMAEIERESPLFKPAGRMEQVKSHRMLHDKSLLDIEYKKTG